ncbi:MAG: D-alanyl-D-alanine carboxypeptidase/D-alanyl-D-alanine-endopeptidase [Planctomycetota bacterium]
MRPPRPGTGLPLRHILPCVLLLAACATTDATVDTDLAAPLRRFDTHAVQVAALVVDLDTGEVLLEREADRLLRPASTQKILTTAAACRRAPDGAVLTRLVADTVPEGHVTLFGDGDPFLGADELRALARELHAQGLRSVRDGITVVDPLAFGPRFGEGWMWDDEPAAFMPPLTAAPVDSACVTVEVTGQGANALAVQLLPTAGDLEVTAQPGDGALAVSRGRYRDPARIDVTGRVRAGETIRRRLSVPEPARFTGHALAAALAEAGIGDGSLPVRVVAEAAFDPSSAALASHRRPLAEVVHKTNKDSDNLGAELLLRRLPQLVDPAAPMGADAASRGLAELDRDLQQLGFDPAQFRLADGSGVSHYTLLSARLLVAELVDMHRRGGRTFEVFRQSLPVAGEDGTLSNRMRDTEAHGRVRAKTGTISGVSNLAGYVDTASGRHLAFAILVQNFVGSSTPWRSVQDDLCVRLAEL